MMINSETVKNFVESNPKLVYRKETHIPGVYLLKYKNRVFYDNLWNEILQECRGTLVDENYNVVSRPFTKIFNHHENGTTIDRDSWCKAYRKVNGFMAAITKYNGELIISTTGSTSSEFTKMAWDMLDRCYLLGIHSFLNNNNTTLIVEIVHPNDPHIITEQHGVYLLGMRENKWNTLQNALVNATNEYYSHVSEFLGMKHCEVLDARFSDICQEVKGVKHEGFVVYEHGSEKSLKIKSPYYLMSKFLARKNEEKLIKLIDNPHEIKKIVDEEYYGIVDAVCENKEEFISMNEQERLNYIRNSFEKIQ